MLEDVARNFVALQYELDQATGTRAGELAIACLAARHDLQLLCEYPCGCDDGDCPGLLTDLRPLVQDVLSPLFNDVGSRTR
jgi:hypothetical protein